MTKRGNSDEIDHGHKSRKKVKVTVFIDKLKSKFPDLDLDCNDYEKALEVYEDEWEDWLDCVQPFPDETERPFYESEDEFDIKVNDLDTESDDDVIYVGTSKIEDSIGVQASIAKHQRSQELPFEGEVDRCGDGPVDMKGFDLLSCIGGHDEDQKESNVLPSAGTAETEKDESSETYMAKVESKVEFTSHKELKQNGYIMDDIVGRVFQMRPKERINFSDVGEGWLKELAEMENELSFSGGDDPIRLESNHGTSIIWNTTSGKAKCIGFRCVYQRCLKKSQIFKSRLEYNNHCVECHKVDHKKQTAPMEFTVHYADGDFDRLEQCGSCPKLFPIGSIRHYQHECFGKRQIFETQTYAMYEAFTVNKLVGDKRFKTTEEFFCTMFGPRGYYMFLRIVRDGVYDADVKNGFVCNKNVYESKSTNARYYIIGSKSLGICYVGSCMIKILSRFKRHISRMSKGGKVLLAADCICSSFGHLFGVNPEFKFTKETLEFAIANNLDGVNGVEFTNVIRK